VTILHKFLYQSIKTIEIHKSERERSSIHYNLVISCIFYYINLLVPLPKAYGRICKIKKIWNTKNVYQITTLCPRFFSGPNDFCIYIIYVYCNAYDIIYILFYLYEISRCLHCYGFLIKPHYKFSCIYITNILL